MRNETSRKTEKLKIEVFEAIRNTIFLNLHDFALSYPMQAVRKPTPEQMKVLVDGLGLRENIKRCHVLGDMDNLAKIAEQDISLLKNIYNVLCAIIVSDLGDGVSFEEPPELLIHPVNGAIEILQDCMSEEIGGALYSLIDWVKNCENQKLLFKVVGERLPISKDEILFAINNGFTPTVSTKELTKDIERAVRKKSSQKAAKTKSEADKQKGIEFEEAVIKYARNLKTKDGKAAVWGIIGLEEMAARIKTAEPFKEKGLRTIKTALNNAGYPKKRTGVSQKSSKS